MNKTSIGKVTLSSALDQSRTQANINMNIVSRGLKTMNIDGAYLLGQGSDNALNFNIKMNKAEAIIFDPFVKDIVSNLKGTLSSDIKLTGGLSDPQFNGNITLENTGVTVNYLKTAYTVSDNLQVANSVIKVDNMSLKDIKGGEGIANGTVDLSDISDPDIEIELKAKNLMALNTNFKDNHLYFGTAFATGTFKFNGPTDNMNIDIKAKTDAGTVFNIPLNTSSTASDYDFIRYVNHNDTAKAVNTVKKFDGIRLNFDLSVDEKTTVKITTDYGKLEGNGIANNLKMNISSLGDFNMFGDFLITTGKFEFIAKDVITKNFQVTQGGTIRWTGDPTNAGINLKAIYEVRTDISPLYNAAGQAAPPKGNNILLVQADLILTNTLLQPVIDFDFNFPTDPSVKDDLGTYLNDYNNRSQQALSVIMRRSFASGTGNANETLTNQALSTAGEAFSEFAFNKINAVISQSNAIRNLDLNIRSFNDASASLHLFNERFLISGSLFNSNGSNLNELNSNVNLFNSNFNTLSKDFSAQYLILKNGNLNARYSYRLLNNTTLNNIDQSIGAQYVNGLGLVYQRDFDTFGEFIKHIFRSGDRKKTVNPLPEPMKAPSVPAPPSTKLGDGKGNEEDDQ
jgi:hypothetical protein